MSNIGFSTSPALPWNEHDNPKSILHRLSTMVAQASIGSQPFNTGEWTTMWKAVGIVMGNSDPVEVCDQEKHGFDYLEELIVALGGLSNHNVRTVYQLNGTTQYIELFDEHIDGQFLFSGEFTGEAGQDHYITSHTKTKTYIRITPTGDMEVKFSENNTVTVPAVDVGDITKMRKIEIGRTVAGNVRIRINGETVKMAIDQENGEFGFQYIGTDPTASNFSSMAICNVSVINKHGAHFYTMDDKEETLMDDGAVGYDGQIVNYDQNNWAHVQYIPNIAKPIK